jgi:hypothetical protein
MRYLILALAILVFAVPAASACYPAAAFYPSFAPVCAPCVAAAPVYTIQQQAVYAQAAPVYAQAAVSYAAPAVSYAQSYYAPSFAPAYSYGYGASYGVSRSFNVGYGRSFAPAYGFNRGFSTFNNVGFNRGFSGRAFDIAAAGGAVAQVNINQSRGLFGGGGLFGGRRGNNISVQAIGGGFGGAAANVNISRGRGLFGR